MGKDPSTRQTGPSGSTSTTFGDRLRHHRTLRDWTQSELAERAGVSQRCISDLERGERKIPQIATITQLADAFDLKDEEREAFIARKRQAMAQIEHEQADPADFEHGPRSLRAPFDLPPRAPGFVGREEDLQKLCALLRKGQGAGIAVAVVGMGGLGKSSLAAEAVHTLGIEPGSFAGGITWVRCDDRMKLNGLTWIDDQLLTAWGAPLAAEAIVRATSPEESLALRERGLRERILSAADEPASPAPALVLLDNVERGLPLKRLLETLQPLGVTTLLTMRAEPPSPLVHLLRLETLALEAAIQLFAERYTARGGKWSEERDTSAAAAITQALGELPLAIELAAAHAARMRLPLAVLAQELDCDALLSRLSDPIDPNASVRYSLGKTLHALAFSQRVCFAALGLPEGADWALPVIERLVEGVSASFPETGESDTSPQTPLNATLEALVTYSLVDLVVGEGPDIPRVRMHPLVRKLAREEWGRLHAADQMAALSTLLAGVLDWLAAHQTPEPGFSARLGLDENLIAGALRMAVARKVDLPLVITIVDAWEGYLFGNGHLDVEMRTLQVKSARTLGDRQKELAALNTLIRACGFSGREDEAGKYRREALAIARELGDQVEVLRMLGAIGEETATYGARPDAERLYAEGEAIASALGEQLIDFDALNNLGNSARALDRPAEAEHWYQRALASAQATGHRVNKTMAKSNLAMVYNHVGNTADAQRIIEELVSEYRSLGYAYGLGALLNGLGHFALMAGDLETAANHLTEALPLLEQSGVADLVKHVQGNHSILKGLQAQQLGERAAAAQAFEEALCMFEQIGRMSDAFDQLPFVRQLIAELQKPPGDDTPCQTRIC